MVGAWLVFIIHLLVIINNDLYVFFRQSDQFDWVYFTIVLVTIISWNVTGKECILSYYEKQFQNPDYVYDSEPTKHPTIEKLGFGNAKFASIIAAAACMLLFYNLFIMLRIYETNYFVIGAIFSVISYNLISARMHVLMERFYALFG
jgi:hypothetical protein